MGSVRKSKGRNVPKADLDHWKKLDNIDDEEKVTTKDGGLLTGIAIRQQALEWLRLESVRLAYITSEEQHVRIAAEQDHDLAHAFGHERDKLISWPPTHVARVYPYFQQGHAKYLCFEVLKPAGAHLHDVDFRKLKAFRPTERAIISIDPEMGTEVLLESLRQYLKDLRKDEIKEERQRAPGAGRTYSLVKLREALLSYEEWIRKAPLEIPKTIGPREFKPTSARDNVTIRTIGERLKSFGDGSMKPDILERRALDALELARKMIKTAAFKPTRMWPITFR